MAQILTLPTRQLLPRTARTAKTGALLSPQRLVPALSPGFQPPPAPPTPPVVDWTAGQTQWGAMGNDTAGDCVLAAMAHLVECWTGVKGNRYTTPDQVVLN